MTSALLRAGHDLAGVHADPALDAELGERRRAAPRPRARARSASSSCTTGTPKTAITASPMNFSTRAAVPLDRSTSCDVEVPRDHGAQRLRVEPLAERGRAGDVAEEDGDDLPLLAHGPRLGERRAARVAEARPLTVLRPAARTDRHRGSLKTEKPSWDGFS